MVRLYNLTGMFKPAKIPSTCIPKLQSKLEIGTPGDHYERAADAMAATVMSLSVNSPLVRLKCAGGAEDDLRMKPLSGISIRMQPMEEEEEMLQPLVQRQPLEEEEEEIIQPQTETPRHVVPNRFPQKLAQSMNGGAELPGATNQLMSSAFRTDFSSVRIHSDANAGRLSRELGARAFTYRDNIYFGNGEYSPSTPDGKRLLAHELTHVIQQTGDTIRRVAMPAEAGITTMEDYGETTRQQIRYDTGYELQSVASQYFQEGIVMDVREGYNVTYAVRGFSPGEQWVANALRALALYSFNLNGGASENATVNITTVQHLDLSSQTNPADETVHGPNANIRFTSTRFDPTGSGETSVENVQLLIEKLSDFSATATTETVEERRQRFETTYQITNAVPVRNDPLGDPLEAMSDSQFDIVLAALDHVPGNLLSRVTNIPIHRSLDARGADGEVAEYSQDRPAGSTTWNRRITVFGEFFRMNADQQAFIMIHEIGHALDYRPNEDPGDSGGASLSATTGQGSFRRAVQDDGGLARGVSTYAATTSDYDEYYAEAFALFRSQPETLRVLRPHVYEYFNTQYPANP